MEGHEELLYFSLRFGEKTEHLQKNTLNTFTARQPEGNFE